MAVALDTKKSYSRRPKGVPVYRTGLNIDAGRRPMGAPVPRGLIALNVLNSYEGKKAAHIS